MGFEEKLNPNSTWYKKRHAQLATPVIEPISFHGFQEPRGFLHRLWREIKNIIRFLKGGN